jgi:putative transposase
VKRSKLTEEQIAFALEQAELGTSVAEVCRNVGIKQATLYVWKKRCAGDGTSELRRLVNSAIWRLDCASEQLLGL